MSPPYRIFNEFLPNDLADNLLDYASAHQQAFQATTTYNGHDPAVRCSRSVYLGEPLKQSLEQQILPLTEDFISSLRVNTFQPAGLELELVAHTDGAFYRRHIDTATGNVKNSTRQRMISAVLYLHRAPRAFSGGALRLYCLGQASAITDFVDIDPTHNSLVIFPSWVPHSVQPVSCLSGEFMDARFAINAWLWRTNPATASSSSGE